MNLEWGEVEGIHACKYLSTTFDEQLARLEDAKTKLKANQICGNERGKTLSSTPCCDTDSLTGAASPGYIINPGKILLTVYENGNKNFKQQTATHGVSSFFAMDVDVAYLGDLDLDLDLDLERDLDLDLDHDLEYDLDRERDLLYDLDLDL